MLVAVISDTHMAGGRRRLPARCAELIASAEVVLHAGDIMIPEALVEIEAIGTPVRAIVGNMDGWELRDRLPAELETDLDGARVAMLHDAGPAAGRLARMRRRFPDAAAVIFGHSHIPLHEREGDFQIFNPGSPTERRRAPSHSMGLARVESGAIEFEHVVLDASVALGRRPKSRRTANGGRRRNMHAVETRITKTEEEWRRELTPEQYEVLRRQGTEPPFTGQYVYSKEDGMYRCAACGNDLFSSDTKFDSGTGWPSFYEPATAEPVELRPDTATAWSARRPCARAAAAISATCSTTAPHPTGQRYCINSLSRWRSTKITYRLGQSRTCRWFSCSGIACTTSRLPCSPTRQTDEHEPAPACTNRPPGPVRARDRPGRRSPAHARGVDARVVDVDVEPVLM